MSGVVSKLPGPIGAIAKVASGVISSPKAQEIISGGGGVNLQSAISQIGTGLRQTGIIRGGRRRRKGLTTSEMGKIMFMSQVLGRNNPAVTFAVMKAIGGRI